MTELRPFQQRTRDKLLSERSFILQAPTGAGKTRAALEPFFAAWEQGHPTFPRKCLYVVPRRVLASQFYRDYKAAAEQRCPGIKVKIQTGEQADDPKLNADLIFCTIDQFLSSYLTMPYGLPRRIANVNAGALVGAYIVMDEFHLHDPSPTLPTALHALRRLSKVAPVLLMTATFSADMLQQLAGWLNADSECLTRAEITAIDTDNGRRAARERIWYACEAQLSAASVLQQHGNRSIALCNTVARAQQLFRDLRDLCKKEKPDAQVILLHSRFLKEHRAEDVEKVISLFGKDADRTQGSYILVATQVIEVGVDITCQALHTETAPASSLIQRAGRCARYPSERGSVFVYPVGSAKNDLLPYDGMQAEEMLEAYDWIRAHSGMAYDFTIEQEFINAVAEPRDRVVIEGLKLTQDNHTDRILRVLKGDLEQAAQALIRDADSRTLLIHSSPDVLLRDPYNATGFAVSPETLCGAFRKWRDIAAQHGKPIQEWIWKLVEDDKRDREGDDTKYHWEGVESDREFFGAQVIAVNPLLAGYDRDEGLLIDRPSESVWQSWIEVKRANTIEIDYGKGYQLETYEEHIRLVLEALNDTSLKELERQMQALERAAEWKEGSLTRAARLAALLHDVGKLSVRWQSWLQAYQREIGRAIPAHYRGAHTDSMRGNPEHEAAQKKTAKLKSPHAAEGAVATLYIVQTALEQNNELRRAVATAIARHHSATADSFTEFQLVSDAAAQVILTLKHVDSDLQQQVKSSLSKLIPAQKPSAVKDFATLMANPAQDFEWLAYTLLVRALRIADGEGTGRGALH
jgi:CRISPR-associated endonuclease/helicase Cas3